MSEFDTSLLREKFIIQDIGSDMSDEAPVIALSNRMEITLKGKTESEAETFIVRTQNMHSCVRIGAAIAREHADRGSLNARMKDFRWDTLWKDVIKGYEKDWNPDIWCAIYTRGRPVFRSGELHPFLDIVEQCAAHTKGDYAASLPFAEQAFQQAGKMVKIKYDSNIALVVAIGKEEAKCGIILRGANKKTTFNFRAVKSVYTMEELRIPTILSVCASFLEGIQLAFHVGMFNRKYDLALIEKYSDEYRKGLRSTKRLGNLGRAITSFNETYDVKYRPEAPDFQQHVTEAERFAMKLLKPLVDDKMAGR